MTSEETKRQRVWDRFLTEQDKAQLRLVKDRRVDFGTRPALLLIDLYRWVFGDGPVPLVEGVKTWPNYCGMAGWNTIPHIQKVLAEARRARIPVVHLTCLSEAEAGITDWYPAAHRGSGWASIAPVREHLEHQFDIIPEVAPIKGEAIFKRSAPSAFWGTPLVAHLNFLRVDTLLVAGETTSGCVRATVVDGCTNRYRMQVIEECVFDRHEACHAMSLFDMHQKYADVISLDKAVNYLQHLSDSKPS